MNGRPDRDQRRVGPLLVLALLFAEMTEDQVRELEDRCVKAASDSDDAADWEAAAQVLRDELKVRATVKEAMRNA
jgi:hypothetical protein